MTCFFYFNHIYLTILLYPFISTRRLTRICYSIGCIYYWQMALGYVKVFCFLMLLFCVLADGFWTCMRSVSSGGYTYLSVWNNDSSVTGTTTYTYLSGVNYQFACVVSNSNTIQNTCTSYQFFTRCRTDIIKQCFSSWP